MTIEQTLLSIDTSLKAILALQQNRIPAGESGVAGAGADPVVAQQVDTAIAAATPAALAKPRGRGRPPKTETTEAAPPAQPAVTAAAAAAAAPAYDPFALDGTPTVSADKPRTLDEVRAALAVYQAYNDQTAALKLFKDATGVETMAKLVETAKTQPAILSKLFKAAIPADKFTLADVRVVLVKANGRKANSGLGVLNDLGAADIGALPESKYVEAILAAHKVQ